LLWILNSKIIKVPTIFFSKKDRKEYPDFGFW
jgi:hypothetical protein